RTGGTAAAGTAAGSGATGAGGARPVPPGGAPPFHRAAARARTPCPAAPGRRGCRTARRNGTARRGPGSAPAARTGDPTAERLRLLRTRTLGHVSWRICHQSSTDSTHNSPARRTRRGQPTTGDPIMSRVPLVDANVTTPERKALLGEIHGA